MDNPETLETLGTQDTERRRTNQNTAQKPKKVRNTNPPKCVPNAVLCKTAVCCCVYLNSREYLTPVRGPIGSNWSHWLKEDPV